MGPGVGADQTFEALVEARLNQEHAGGKFQRYEILNFSVSGYGPIQNLADLDPARQAAPAGIPPAIRPPFHGNPAAAKAPSVPS